MGFEPISPESQSSILADYTIVTISQLVGIEPTSRQLLC